ncbi:hypothetical protein ACLMJK_002634 [Lecanora helva]
MADPMILTGVLRHYASVLLQTTPKKQELAALREQRSLLRGINLRSNYSAISRSAFNARKEYLVSAYKDGTFLKDPESRGKPAGNPMTDPAAMEGMMGMMKGNMAMMIPQTLIMSWINAFFAGFVISMCTYPLGRSQPERAWTYKNASNSEAAVPTHNSVQIDATIRNRYSGSRSANQMAQQMSQMNPGAGAGMFQPGQDPDKLFQNEAENIEVIEHECILDGIEERLLASI